MPKATRRGSRQGIACGCSSAHEDGSSMVLRLHCWSSGRWECSPAKVASQRPPEDVTPPSAKLPRWFQIIAPGASVKAGQMPDRVQSSGQSAPLSNNRQIQQTTKCHRLKLRQRGVLWTQPPLRNRTLGNAGDLRQFTNRANTQSSCDAQLPIRISLSHTSMLTDKHDPVHSCGQTISSQRQSWRCSSPWAQASCLTLLQEPSGIRQRHI